MISIKDLTSLSPSGSSDGWTRLQLSLLILLVVSGFLLGWSGRITELRWGEDEAVYTSLSHSLEAGHYRDTYLVGSPLHSKYPPGFPALIAIVHRIAGPGLDPILLVNYTLFLVALLLVADSLRMIGQPWLGVGTVATLALNRTYLLGAAEVFSDPFFTFLVAVSLWAALKAELRPRSRWVIVAVLAALGSFAVRTAGVAVMAAFVMWLLLRRRWSDAALFCASVVVVAGGWFAYIARAQAHTVALGYASDLASSDGTTGALISRVVSNGFAYVTRIVPSALELPVVQGVIVDNVAWLLIELFFGVFGFLVLTRYWAPAAVYLLASVGMLLLWPWPIDRLYLPLLPWVVATLLLGAAQFGRLFLRLRPESAGLVIACVLAVFGLSAQLREGRLQRSCNGGGRLTRPECAPDDERSLLAATYYVRDSLPRDAVIVTGKPATMNYYTGRKTLPMRVVGQWANPSPAAQEYKAATHVLLSKLVGAEQQAAPILLANCANLRLLTRFPPNTLLFQVTAVADSASSACTALRAYRKSDASPP